MCDSTIQLAITMMDRYASANEHVISTMFLYVAETSLYLAGKLRESTDQMYDFLSYD